jgi:SagB-type dehydrogenase family enzyme
MRPIPHGSIRPVVAAEPIWSAVGAVFGVGDRTVEIGGDPHRVRAIIDACDGRATVTDIAAAHGSDAAELLEGLLRLGILVDAELGWRRFHALSSNPTSWTSSASDDELRELLDETYGPQHGTGAPIPLEPGPSSVLAIARRRSSATPSDEPRGVSWTELSTVLSSGYGRGDEGRFTVPSGGGMYGLVLHVLLRQPCGPLDAGVWWYDPWRGEVRLQASTMPDLSEVLAPDGVIAALSSRRTPSISISADLRRPSRKYGPRAYRLALLEAGAVMESMYLAAAELGVPIRACSGFLDDRLAELVSLPDGVVPTLLMLLGS